jgi:hypothetical protein
MKRPIRPTEKGGLTSPGLSAMMPATMNLFWRFFFYAYFYGFRLRPAVASR